MHASSTFIRRRQWHPTPVLLPGNSHGWRSLVGCSPWGRKESDTTERLHFHSSLACSGEGHGNPLQCSCLENPRAGGAWWAAVCGVAQSRTRLKRLSSSTFTGSRRCWEPHLLAALLILTCFLAPLWFWQHPLFLSEVGQHQKSGSLKPKGRGRAGGARHSRGGEAPGCPAPLPPPSPLSPRVLRLLRGVLALVALPLGK